MTRIDTFDDYQTAAARTAIYPEDTKIFYPGLGLTGEVAEVAEKVGATPDELGAVAKELSFRMSIHAGRAANQIKKVIRDDGDQLTEERRAAIGKEIGGVLWYCAALATDLGLNLGDIARENIKILADRQERGALTGDGDNR